MVTYKADLPKKTASSHVGLNVTQELFDQDRERQTQHLFKGKPRWRDDSKPTTRVRMKDVWLTGRQYHALVAKRACRSAKRRAEERKQGKQ